MGANTARDMAEQVALSNVRLDVALEYHLTGNHYPPLPRSLVPTCKAAIQNALNDDWDALVELPEGISWRGEKFAPTSECVREWHLSLFLDNDEE